MSYDIKGPKGLVVHVNVVKYFGLSNKVYYVVSLSTCNER